MLCEYAFDSDNVLVFVDDVEKGEKCNCICPCCGEKMIAKNGGNIRQHHFAHFSGSDCAGYRESLLHIWSKQIIEEERKIKIPAYKDDVDSIVFIKGNVKSFDLDAQILNFVSVEIEERNDIKSLQPDIVGITDDGLRLWIEIFVTHKCEEDKITLIKENNINCIEIKIPNEIETKEQLYNFLMNDVNQKYKYFINFPYGKNLIQRNKISFLNDLKKVCKIKTRDMCDRCFNDFILQSEYNTLLNEYKNKINTYKWIFSCDKITELMEKSPHIEDWLIESTYKRRYQKGKNNINQLDWKSYIDLLSFVKRLIVIVLSYKHNRRWLSLLGDRRCSFEYGISRKDEKEYVFCNFK